MKKIFLLIILVNALSLYATENLKIQTYQNDRFNFSIDYPSSIFINKEFPANGDGVTMISENKKVTLVVSGTNAVITQDIKEIYKRYTQWLEEKKDTKLTYKVQKKNWFTLSGFKNKKKTIFYEKKVLLNEETFGYYLEYPAVEKKKYSRIIKILNKSLKKGKKKKH